MSVEPPPEPEPRAALVVTDLPIAISVAPLEDERTPEGMVCLGTSLQGRLVARCVVPPEAADVLVERDLFIEPVRLALAAQEAPPGLQCRLFALVELSIEPEVREEEEAEPWVASVPSSNYERAIAPDDEEGPGEEAEEDGDRQAAVLLGHIVRFAGDRRHPQNLALEAADVLATIVAGKVSEVVDKVIEDLLENENGNGNGNGDAGSGIGD